MTCANQRLCCRPHWYRWTRVWPSMMCGAWKIIRKTRCDGMAFWGLKGKLQESGKLEEELVMLSSDCWTLFYFVLNKIANKNRYDISCDVFLSWYPNGCISTVFETSTTYPNRLWGHCSLTSISQSSGCPRVHLTECLIKMRSISLYRIWISIWYRIYFHRIYGIVYGFIRSIVCLLYFHRIKKV